MGNYRNNGKQVIFQDGSAMGLEPIVHIADAGDNEKAHFLATAANSFGIVNNYVDEARVTLSASWHGDKVAKAQLLGRINGAIDAANKLDQVKKTLFYGRDNNLIADGQTPVGNAMLEAMGDGNADPANIIHGVIGIFTEAGELLEALRSAYNGNGFDPINMREEIGDMFWYVAILLFEASRDGDGYTFEECMRVNIAKLRARFPNAFVEYDANNRDLAAERLILEGAPVYDPRPAPLLTEAEPATGREAVERAADSADAAFAAVNNVGKPYADANVDGNKTELGKSPAHRMAPLPGENLARQPVRPENE